MKKYVIFGAGRMGRAVAWHLVSDLTTSAVLLVDVDKVALDSLKSEFNNVGLGQKVLTYETSPQLDASKLTALFSGYDVCVATCGYQSYVSLVNVCINANVHMVDLGGNRDVVDQQRVLHDRAVDAKVTIIPDCGLAPGMIGILGMYAFEALQHRKCANIDVSMRVGGLPMNPGTREQNPLQYALSWSSDGLINEYLIPADELRDGKLVKVQALTSCEDVIIHTPWSRSEFEAFVTGGGSSNLPFILQGKARNVDYKTLRYRGHCAIMQGIRQLEFFEGTQRQALTKILDSKLTLHDNDDIVIARAGARGQVGNGKTAVVVYEVFCSKDVKRNFSAMAQTTGFSAAIIAQMIADGTVTMKGVVSGETAVPGDSFVARLKSTGIKIIGTQR